MKTLSLKPLLAREVLLKKKIFIFSPRDFSRIFHLSNSKTKYFLEEYAQRGLFLRLKKGLYTLKADQPIEEEIANALYKPSYISFEYALSFYNILPEMVYPITSATTKPTRSFVIENKSFLYFTIKKQAFTGYQLLERQERTVLIAEPEKAFIDYLYFVSLGKKAENDRLDLSSLNKNKVLEYSSLYNRAGLNKLAAKLL